MEKGIGKAKSVKKLNRMVSRRDGWRRRMVR